MQQLWAEGELTCCDGEGSETLAHAATLGRGRGLTYCDDEGSGTLARSVTWVEEERPSVVAKVG